MPIDKSKVSIPIKDLKHHYEEPIRKIKQDANGLEPVSIRTKKTKKISIDNQIQKETIPNKLFDDGVRKTYRRKKTQDPNQKYRRYKTQVEAKLYENLVGEPEQSIVEAIKEATEQLKAPSIRKIIKDANKDNGDLDASEIRTENDVRQPKKLNVKQQQNVSNQEELDRLFQDIEDDMKREGYVKKGQPFNAKDAEEKLPKLQSALKRLNQKQRLEYFSKQHDIMPSYGNVNKLYKQQEEKDQINNKLIEIKQKQAARVIQKLARQRGRPPGSKDKTPRKVRGTTKPFEVETVSPIPTATGIPAGISSLAQKSLSGISPSLSRKIAHRVAGNKLGKIETEIKKPTPTTPAMRMLATKPSPRLLNYSPP